MGKDNRARRRAKQARRQHRPAAPVGPRPRQSPVGSFEAAREAFRRLVVAWPAERTEEAWLLDELACGDVAPIVEAVGQGCMADAVAEALLRGWRPSEVAHAARRPRATSAASRDLLLRALDRPDGLAAGWLGDDDRRRQLRVMIEAVAFVCDLPKLPDWPAAPVPTATDPDQDRMLEKVRALLAKAESTEFDEEAESLTAKAQELMARYAIDRATVEATLASSVSVPVGTVRISIDEPYVGPKSMLVHHIAKANRCRSVWSEHHGFATVVGAHTDLAVVELLFTSLLVQAVAAMRRAGSRVDADGRSRTRSFRHSFLLAFGARIGERLREATDAAVAAAIDESGDAFLPVLASRSDATERAVKELFPRLSSSSLSYSNVDGYVAGRVAADLAHLEPGPSLEAS